MISEYKSNIIMVLTSLAILVLFLMLPFSIYGNDGYYLWFPIIAEYLTGDANYHASEVIFNGQNLAGVYGELPFWKLLRLFDPSVETFLNLTHGIWIILFSTLCLGINGGFKKEKNIWDIIFIFTYAILTPVAINRVMAGHLNLLFGTLPFFVLISLIFNKSYLNCIFGIFCIWCAFSTQAFQILSYHLLYAPLLVYLIWRFETRKINYIVLAIAVVVTAFALNFQNFMEMFQHATNPNNLRSLNTNMVYTYTVSTWVDSLQFLTSGIYPEILQRDAFFFHELNYPIGAFLIILFFVKEDQRMAFGILFGLILIMMFCMNIPGFNLLSEIPYFFKPYRVPQRAFMIIAMFIPVWTFSRISVQFKSKYFVILICLILVSQFVAYFEILAFLAVGLFLYHPKYKNVALALIIALAGLATGSLEKLSPVLNVHNEYLKTKLSITPLIQQYSREELRKTKFHFVTAQPALVNYVAQSMGISTLEGYGHPPASLLIKFMRESGLRFSPYTNSLYLPPNLPNSERIFKGLGISKVVSFNLDNQIVIRSVEH